MGDVPGFDPTLILWLNLVGTFVFGLSGGLAGVRARLDVFGVVVLSAVVGLAGGIVRDLQRAISHPFRRLKRTQTRVPRRVPLTSASCGPP